MCSQTIVTDPLTPTKITETFVDSWMWKKEKNGMYMSRLQNEI